MYRRERKKKRGNRLKSEDRIQSDKYCVWIKHMSVTWITLLVVNQEDSHIVNIKVSSYI